MISDVLFDAEKSIKEYLDGGHYGDSDNPTREAIENLLRHMEAVRFLPGLDRPPVAEGSEVLDVAAVQVRWPGIPRVS